MAFVYQPIQDKLLPDIAEAVKAEKLAKQADKPDPRPLLAIIAQTVQADLRLLGILSTRADQAAAYDWDIVPSDPNNPAAVEIAQQTKERVLACGLANEFDTMLNGIAIGTAIINQVWSNTELGMTATLNVIPATQSYYTQGKFFLIKDTSDFQLDEIKVPDQYICIRYNPLKFVNPDFIGAYLHVAMWLVMMKHFNYQDWGKFNELFAQPLRYAQWKVGASDEDKAIALQAVKDLGSDAFAAVSEDVIIKFIEAVRTGSIEAYKELLASINTEYAILFLGQNLTTEITNDGSRAAAQVHQSVMSNKMWVDLQRVRTIINTQHIAVDFRLNSKTKDISLRPSFEWLIDDPIDTEKNARTVAELRAAGVPLKKKEVYEKTGFTEPQAGDEVFE